MCKDEFFKGDNSGPMFTIITNSSIPENIIFGEATNLPHCSFIGVSCLISVCWAVLKAEISTS